MVTASAGSDNRPVTEVTYDSD